MKAKFLLILLLVCLFYSRAFGQVNTDNLASFSLNESEKISDGTRKIVQDSNENNWFGTSERTLKGNGKSLSIEDNLKVQKIDQLVSTFAQYGQFNGTILVAENGKLLYKKGFGMANFDWSILNQPDTKLRLASVTKQFTAMLIMQLVVEKKLDLNVPISNYLPDYPNAEKITIHHLLTHTAGIPNYTSFPNYRDVMNKSMKPAEIVKLFADSTLLFTPGEKHDYSNSGYVLLGVIIEKVTGKTLETVLNEKILLPLNMHNTGFEQTGKVLKNKASGYDKFGISYHNTSYIDMSIAYSAGGMYSTVEDLLLWDQALYTEKLIPKKYMNLIFAKHIPFYGRHYGYGWEIGDMAKGNSNELLEVYNHSGVINGFNSLITRIPEDKSTIILLSNVSNAPLHYMSKSIGGILYGKPYDLPKKSLAYSLQSNIIENGLAETKLFHQKVKDSVNYYHNENEMNLAGYDLLNSSMKEAAAFVFQLNVNAFPNSYNAYDSYGEALMSLGKKEAAIENYKKSVIFNPNNENGLKVLHDLGIDTDALKIKTPMEQVNLIVGNYTIIDDNRDWKIEIVHEMGELYAIDKGYKFRMHPVGDSKFINTDDGASLEFNFKNKNQITFVMFGKFNFKKI